jgi:hypothetical protein
MLLPESPIVALSTDSVVCCRLPPPKRVKLSGPSLDVPAPVIPKAPTVVVQFRSSVDGSSMGPAVSLPADTGRDGMEMLVNRLKGGDDVSWSLVYVSIVSGPAASFPSWRGCRSGSTRDASSNAY